MKQNDVITLFERIKNNYNMFTYNDEKVKEWHRFLKDYDKDDINDNLDNYIMFGYENPPLVYSLIKNTPKLKQSEKEDVWTTRCDICKKEITIYNNDMSEYDKHYRKCQKIDFINDMSKRFRGTNVALAKYYEMNDEELEKAYRKIMDFYLQNREEKDLFKKMPEED